MSWIVPLVVALAALGLAIWAVLQVQRIGRSVRDDPDELLLDKQIMNMDWSPDDKDR